MDIFQDKYRGVHERNTGRPYIPPEYDEFPIWLQRTVYDEIDGKDVVFNRTVLVDTRLVSHYHN